MKHDHPIIFFDGVCNLCNTFIDWVVRHDKQKTFRIASLQGDTAKKYNLAPNGDASTWSVLLRDSDGQVYQKSTAVIKIVSVLGSIYSLIRIGYILPPFIRNRLYQFVAKNRYKWFKKKESCRLATPEEREFFLP